MIAKWLSGNYVVARETFRRFESGNIAGIMALNLNHSCYKYSHSFLQIFIQSLFLGNVLCCGVIG